ncbi:MAG: MBL fold metallo-hydrolase [Bacteroidetes bacterium]|nr:MBL fold metallo-hydrolase [Bacteroidota bacterium]
MFSAPKYLGPVTDHFDGNRFFNQGVLRTGFKDLLRWIFHRDAGPWRSFTEYPPGPPPPERAGEGELLVTFVNHSTVLIQLDGVNILTDPVWSHRISPVSFAGPVRHRPAGIRFEDLPPIDVVLLSHNHYDHLDAPTMQRLAREHGPRIFTSLGNTAYLESIGVGNSSDMDWWDGAELPGHLQLTCVPAQHFSGRGLGDRDCTLWCGFVVEGKGGTVYFAADTGMAQHHFTAIRERFNDITLALLPIGAYRPRWFMAPVHMGPDEAVEAHLLLQARQSMGIHFGTFAQADDGEFEPIELLNETLDVRGIAREEFFVLENGASRLVTYAGVG